MIITTKTKPSGGFFIPKGVMSDEEIARIRAKWEELYGGKYETRIQKDASGHTHFLIFDKESVVL